VLDLYGDKGRETVGTDIAEGKRSALVVHALGALSDGDRQRLATILDKERTGTTPDEIAEAIALLDRAGSRAYALDEIRQRRKRALEVPAVASDRRLFALVEGMADLFIKPIQALM